MSLSLICTLSSRQVEYPKRGAYKRPQLCGRFSMHTIFLCKVGLCVYYCPSKNYGI